MKTFFIAILLCLLSINSISQTAYEVTNESPIAVQDRALDSLKLIDPSGKLTIKEIAHNFHNFKRIEDFDGNFTGKTWTLFKFKNKTNRDIDISIGGLAPSPLSEIYEINSDNITSIENKFYFNKNEIAFTNIYSNKSAKVRSRYPQFSIERNKEVLILIGSNRADNLIEFRNLPRYLEWNRGAIYYQGILLGIVFALALLAAFSAYKYRDVASYWYILWLIILFFDVGFNFVLNDGSRASEFIYGQEFNIIYHSEVLGLCYLLFSYYTLDINQHFYKYKRAIFSSFAFTLVFTALNAIDQFSLLGSNTTEITKIIKNYLVIPLTLNYCLSYLTLIYFAIKLRKINSSAKYISLTLALFLFSNFGIEILAVFGVLENYGLMNYIFSPYLYTLTLLSLQAIVMGFSVISKSKDVQDNLIRTTEENNRLVNKQNEILEAKVTERTKELQAQTQKTERLMLNILPASIADRLKSGEEGISDSYQNATILFSDLVGFTKMSSGKSPEELVFLLNDLFKRFDLRALSLGLEKIKTIGDAYMVVGGLPTKDDDHAVRVTKMALGMYEDLAEFNKEHCMELDMRIGINSGPVVAGVIGHSKFSYDLWGNTVNVASRMESTSIPGQVQVSPSTYEQIKDHFDVRERELIECKGLGMIMTYILNK